MNFLFWFSMRKEVSRFYDLKKRGLLELTQEQLSEDMFMGKGIGRAIDRYSIPSLIIRIRNKNSKDEMR